MRAARLAAAVCGLLLLAACDDDSAGGGAGGLGGLGATTGSTTSAPSTTQNLSAFEPSESNQDPSKAIDGVQVREYKVGLHVQAPRRVKYDQSPPYGGAHDQLWAACNGVVYAKAVRTENMVHTLEHGAIWIAYNPADVTGDKLAVLTAKVTGKTYISISPYPGLDHPVSVQAWGHQLKVDDVADPRIDQFVTALRVNRYTTPEPGASCDQLPDFDPEDPPPFDPSPPGPDAMAVDGSATGPAGSPTTTG